MWIYNPFVGQLVFVIVPPQTLGPDGSIQLGESITGDISVDTGDRSNESSIIDSGSRLV